MHVHHLEPWLPQSNYWDYQTIIISRLALCMLTKKHAESDSPGLQDGWGLVGKRSEPDFKGCQGFQQLRLWKKGIPG